MVTHEYNRSTAKPLSTDEGTSQASFGEGTINLEKPWTVVHFKTIAKKVSGYALWMNVLVPASFYSTPN